MIVTGPSNRDSQRTEPEARLARDAGIDVIVIGVGPAVDQRELAGIASRKSSLLLDLSI